MSDRKIIGWQPIREPEPGSIVTHAFILCRNCGATISTNSGPRHDAWCPTCVVIEAR